LLTIIHLSLTADLMLSSILILLWTLQRSERHALLWASSHFCMALAVFLWSADQQAATPATPGVLLAGLHGWGLFGLWLGTRYFCGRPLKWVRSLLGLGLYTLGMGLLITQAPSGAGQLATLLFGLLLLWCGAQLIRRKQAYRILGLIFVLRGLLNFGFVYSLHTGIGLGVMFILAFFFKLASSMGLIYATLHETRQRYAATLDSLSNGFAICDEYGVIQLANDKLARLLGLESGNSLTGAHFACILLNTRQDEIKTLLRTLKHSTQPVVQEFTLQCPQGDAMPVEIIGSTFNERGRPMALLHLLDISDRQTQQELLKRAAMFDALSGLYNRHALQHFLRESLSQSVTDNHECSVLFLDLDHFKRINDSLGHSVGDQLLVMVSERLRSLVKAEDFLARFGGDEFIIVQPALEIGTSAARALALARSITASFAAPFSLSPQSSMPFTLFVTPSIGIAHSPAHGLHPDALIKGADLAMYAAKAAGRNEIRLFDTAMDDASRSAMMIEEAMHHALAEQEFRLVYQPIVDARSSRMHKVEALLRWDSKTLGNVPPDRFIPVAEESGLIVELGQWVLQEACRQARRWADSPIGPVCISINVSAWQLVDTHFATLLRDAIHENNISPEQIEIELTERVLIEEGDTVREVLETIHSMGVSIALDDFGTGYSSLSYLTRFQLDTLKIDRSFITHIESSERASALVRAIIAMGHSLGLQIVAEGIETHGQATLLTHLGCQSLQGYFFSRPIPAEQIQPAPPIATPD
jgi:diguanylate cyclase (GGDEF)-like protein/PAS domain S-box-containing protein